MRSILTICILIAWPLGLAAEDMYITDQLEAGLYEDKSLDSPIIKVVPTGTRLEIVKREDKLTFVRDASGATGWIDNDYLIAKAPANASLEALQTRADDLEQRLSEARDRNVALETRLKNSGKDLPAQNVELTNLRSAHAALQQKFKTQKLRNGELQIELTELRNRLGQDSDTEVLYDQLKNLQEENKKLEVQLANTLEKYGVENGAGFPGESDAGKGFSPDLRNIIIYLAITLVLGLFGGAYILDLVNRRRHGGFRI